MVWTAEARKKYEAKVKAEGDVETLIDHRRAVNGYYYFCVSCGARFIDKRFGLTAKDKFCRDCKGD